MTLIRPEYTTAQTITIDVTGLAVGGWRESTAVNNASNLFITAHVGGSIQMGTMATVGRIGIYAYGIAYGSVYTGRLSGTDATVVWGTTPAASDVEGYRSLFRLGIVEVNNVNNKDIAFGPYDVAEKFGGTLPTGWGVAIHNDTSGSFNGTGTNNAMEFTGIKLENV